MWHYISSDEMQQIGNEDGRGGPNTSDWEVVVMEGDEKHTEREEKREPRNLSSIKRVSSST